jgi:CO/xanthine dehydrogenase FAD-binding subunit
MMRVKDYRCPASLQEAIALRTEGAIPFAGGTDLMVKARDRTQYRDKTFIDIGRIPELRFIREEAERISIGACVTLTELIQENSVRAHLPLLWEAVRHVGNCQVRNRATLGGNVANACPAADCIPALMVLGASVTVSGAEGSREIPVNDLFRDCEACLRHEGMQVRTCYFLETATRKLTLKPDELIISFEVPKQNPKQLSLFYKLTENRSGGMAVLNFAMTGRLAENGAIAEFRLCPGSVFPRPICFPEKENPLVGRFPEKALFAEIAREVVEKLSGEAAVLADYAYKIRVLPELIQDGMLELFCGIPMEK